MTGCTACTPFAAPYPAAVLDTAVLDAAVAPVKPPPQVLGVSGIAEQPIVIPDSHRWRLGPERGKHERHSLTPPNGVSPGQ